MSRWLRIESPSDVLKDFPVGVHCGKIKERYRDGREPGDGNDVLVFVEHVSLTIDEAEELHKCLGLAIKLAKATMPGELNDKD